MLIPSAVISVSSTTNPAWDLSSASYDNVSFDVSTQISINNMSGISFKSDGSKLYALDSSGKKVYEYTLSSGWNLSSASYSGVSFSVSSQTSVPTDIFFKSDGTKMYISDFTLSKVYQYTLSVGWDISTASYSGVSFNFSSQAADMGGIFFRQDGLKMYGVNLLSPSVFQYSLSSAWDLSSVSYDNILFTLTSEASEVLSVFFKTDGTRMFIPDITSTTVYQYDISSAWDVSTSVYNGVSFDVSSETSSDFGIFFKSDGLKMYIAGSDTANIYQYSV